MNKNDKLLIEIYNEAIDNNIKLRKQLDNIEEYINIILSEFEGKEGLEDLVLLLKLIKKGCKYT